MKDEDKTKEQLLKELKDLRRQTQEEVSKKSSLFSEAKPAGPDRGKPDTIQVSGIQMEWDPKGGTCTFEKLPVAMMWVDTTLAGLMSGVQAMVGTERFLLALQSEGRKSVETDWQVISQFADFSQGFKAIANIAAVAGWGAWELTSLDVEKQECRFRVTDSWEGLYQQALGVSWGSGMLAGKMAGYCSKLFGTNCWADQTAFIAKGDPYDEFFVRTSSRFIELEIESLLASDEASRADMAVALRKLEKEVAERQRAEDALREYHQKLQAIIQASPLSIFVLDPEGKVLLWNPASESTFGWSAAEVVGRVLPIVPEEKEDEFRDNLHRALAGESLRGVELRRRKKDGTPIDISVFTSTLDDAQGQVTGVLILDADITERKRAEELLKLNELRLEALLKLNQMTDAPLAEITHFAMEEATRLTGSTIGYVAFMNEDETVLTMHAWPRAAMAECRIADKPLLYPVETTGLWGEAVRVRKPIITNDYAAANPWKKGYPQGHVKVLRHMNVPIFDGDKVVIVAGVGNKPSDYDESDVRQLTLLMEGMWRIVQRKRAADKLEQSISLLQATLESTADGLLVIDSSGKIVAYNQKFAQMWRIPEAVMASRDDDRALAFVLEQVKDPEGFLSKVRELYSQAEAESFDLIEFKDGRVFERYSQPQRIGQTIVGRVWSFRDVTARKQAEEALRENEEHYRSLFDNMLNGFAYCQMLFEGNRPVDFIYLNVNRAFEVLTGLTDVIGKKVSAVIPGIQKSDPELFEIYGRVALTGQPERFETYVEALGMWFSVSLYSPQKEYFVAVFDVITERKQAEEALRQSEEKYRLLVNQIPAVAFKGYPDWSIDFFDNKIEMLTGYGKAEFDSRRLKWSELILADDFQEVKDRSREAVKTRSKVYEREYRIRKKDGGLAWLQAMGQIFYDVAGTLDYVSGVFFDITERKRAEEALFKYKFIANTAKDCMTLIDRNYIYEAANAAYCQAHGKTLEEVVGTTVANVWGEDTFKKVIKGYLDRCFTGKTVEFEGWFEFGKKGRGCYHVFYSPYFNKDGTVAYAAVVSHNITARKRAEEALRQSEVKYRQLVDQIPAVVYKGYTNWSLDCFDRKIEAITGYSMEEFNSRQKTWLDLIFPEDIDQAKKLFREAQECDCSYVSEHRIRNKAGEIRWIQARNRIICDAAGKVDYISGVFFDITERKELADQLIKAQRMEAVGILAGGLAHDFNNLLTAIMGYGEIMMMDLRREDPFFAYINEITKAASRGASLTNQLLAFSRKQILQPQVVNLNGVVVDMDKMLRRLIGEDIELVTVIDQELGRVKADPGQIEQIIMNLAVNARDAMPNGGNLTIETGNVSLDEAYARSHVGVTPGPYVMLAISDDGVGMDTETISHIFEPFFTTKESGKGTGLGLATVYGIVKQSGGNIWVYSEPGKGTTFKIYLPLVKEGVIEPKPKAAPPTTLGGEETILLVEDDAALRDLVSTALRKYGFTVLEASHGGEALLICEREKAPIQLMLTDVVMPQISGSALAGRLTLLHPEMKVLYMSGYTENAIVHLGVLDSEVNFIAKPFRLLGLVQKVREVLDFSKEKQLH